ncbi:MAG: MMPL family transporter, partial [Solirubrobacteraceae bacterium]
DYGVQLHARVEEARRRRGLAEDDAVRDAATRGGPPVLLAATASLAGFAALLTSPTPLVRGFAIVLMLGVAIAVLMALTVGMALGPATRGVSARGAHAAIQDWRVRVGLTVVVATLACVPLLTPAWWLSLLGLVAGIAWWCTARVLRRRAAGARERPSTRGHRSGDRERWWSRLGLGGVGVEIGHGPVVRRVVAVAHRRGGIVLLLGGALAIGGMVMGNREPVETNLQRLVPADLPALKDLQTVEASTGLSGELRILVEGADATRAKSIAWMTGLRERVLDVGGYDPRRGCSHATICPLSSPGDVLEGTPDGDEELDALIAQLPEYFRHSVISEDRRSALLTFGMRLGPLQEQRETIDAVRAAVGTPPDGVRATVTGLPVTVADASVEVSDTGRRVLTLILSLVLVGVALTALTRSWRRGLVPLIPVAYGTGWAGLLTWALGLPLNPLSVILGALVVAIGTEFSVLLAERHRQEIEAGHGDAVAIARTAASTGRAVGASAATAIAGFAILAVSDIPLLRQFGLVTVLDLVVALVAVVVVLPALAGVAGRRRARVARRPAAPSAT